jgi:hypothetical protein
MFFKCFCSMRDGSCRTHSLCGQSKSSGRACAPSSSAHVRFGEGHRSRAAGIVVSLKRRSQTLLPSFRFATVRSVGLGVNAEQAEGKASVHEGHGFSRAVKGLATTALAAEVRSSTHTGQSHFCLRLRSPQTIGKNTSGAKALIGPSDVARLNPCPSFINAIEKLWSFRQ